MTDETPLPVLKKLLALSDPADRDVDLAVLQRRIEIYAGFSPEQRQRSLNLQMLPHIGAEYPRQARDLIELSVAHAAVIAERDTNKDDEGGHEFATVSDKVHTFTCTPVGGGESFAATLVEPPDDFQVSKPDFFERLLVSTFCFPWPHSRESLLVSVFFSLTGRAEESALAAAQDAAIGPVIGQLLLSVALAQTALADLSPLVADLRAKSWSRTLGEVHRKKKKGKGSKDASADVARQDTLYRHLLHLGQTAPFPFTAVLREIAGQKAVRSSFSSWLAKREDLADRLLGMDPHVLPAIAAVYPQLRLDDVAARETNSRRALSVAGSIATYDVALAVKSAERVSGDVTTAEERQQSFGVAVAALTSRSASAESLEGAWRILAAVLARATEDERRSMLSAVAALSVAGPQHARHGVQNELLRLASEDEAPIVEDVFAAHVQLATHRISGKLPDIVTVVSQKGGVGKTTLALAVARQIAPRRRVCVIELDFAGPTFHNYAEVAAIPYVNASFYRNEPPDIAALLTRRSVIDGLAVWPADPRWPSLQEATRHARYEVERAFELAALERLLRSLSDAFDVVVLDTPAEVKFVTRTATFITAVRGGTLLLAGSMFGPSYMPLLENYWRVMAAPGVKAALVLNKIRGVDRLATRSTDALHDWLLTNREVPLQAFDMEIESAPLLRAILPRDVPLLAIENSETVERAMRERSLLAILSTMDHKRFAPLQLFVEQYMENRAS